MKGVVWDDESLGANYHDVEIPADLLDQAKEYREKMDSHIKALQDRANAAGMDYYLMVTDRPLDDALREYLTKRQGRM